MRRWGTTPPIPEEEHVPYSLAIIAALQNLDPAPVESLVVGSLPYPTGR
jgi:hypothetical protein